MKIAFMMTTIGAAITSAGMIWAVSWMLILLWIEERGSKWYLAAGACFVIPLAVFLIYALRRMFLAVMKL